MPTTVSMKARVDFNLEKLVPKFFQALEADLEEMHHALDEGNMKKLTSAAHSLKGASYNYGFSGLGDLAREIELAVGDNRKNDVTHLLEVMHDYPGHVDIIYIDTDEF